MGRRVVEQLITPRGAAAAIRVRVDLHGVSTFGPGSDHAVIRWEWIKGIAAEPHGVAVTSANCTIVLPAGIFGLSPETLAARLVEAGSIFERGDVIEALAESQAAT